MMKQLMLSGVFFLAAGTAAGQVMECIDAKGSKTIAQFCPPGTVKEITRGGATPSSAPAAGTGAAAPKSLAERDAEFKKRALERQESETKSEKSKADAKEQERGCLEARAQLRAVTEGQRITRNDSKTGERIVVEDKDRPAEQAAAQKSADQWCNKK